MSNWIWDTKQQQDDFFEKLRSLITEHPCLNGLGHKGDPTDDEYNEQDYQSRGYPKFSEGTPSTIRNVALVFEVMDLDGFWRVYSVDPWGQGIATRGLLGAAYEAED